MSCTASCKPTIRTNPPDTLSSEVSAPDDVVLRIPLPNNVVGGDQLLSQLHRVDVGFSGWFFVGNEGMRVLYNPLKGRYRALIPAFPSLNQGF